MKTIKVTGEAIVTLVSEVEVEVEIDEADETIQDAIDSARPEPNEFTDGHVVAFVEWKTITAKDITDEEEE